MTSYRRPFPLVSLALAALMTVTSLVAFAPTVAAAHSCDAHNLAVDAAHAPADTWSKHNHARWTWSVSSGSFSSCYKVLGYEVDRSWQYYNSLYSTSSRSYEIHEWVPEGTHSIAVRVRYQNCAIFCDTSPRWSTWTVSAAVKIDTNAPHAAFAYEGEHVSDGTTWVGPATTIQLTSSDVSSGVKTVEHALGMVNTPGATPAYAPYTEPFTLDTADGSHMLYGRITDHASNVRYLADQIYYDGTAPDPSFAVSGEFSDDGVLYATSASWFILTADESGSGLAGITYSLDGAPAAAYEEAFQVTGDDGLHTLVVTATDNLGNTASESLSFYLDNTAPGLEATFLDAVWVDGEVYLSGVSLVELAATDAGSGVKEIDYQVDGAGWQNYTAAFGVIGEDGLHTLEGRAADNLDNVATMSHDVRLDNTAPSIVVHRPTANSVTVDAAYAETCSESPGVSLGDERVLDIPDAPAASDLPTPDGVTPGNACEGSLATVEGATVPVPLPDGPGEVGFEDQHVTYAPFIVAAGVATFSADVADAGVGTLEVTLSVDGVVVDTDSHGEGLYVMTWDSSTATLGTHLVTLRAVDHFGHAIEATFEVIVASAAPETPEAPEAPEVPGTPEVPEVPGAPALPAAPEAIRPEDLPLP